MELLTWLLVWISGFLGGFVVAHLSRLNKQSMYLDDEMKISEVDPDVSLPSRYARFKRSTNS